MHVPFPDSGRSSSLTLTCAAMSSRSPTPDLTFVVGNSLEQLRDSANRTVRSHVARVSWSNQQKADSKSKRRRRPPHEITIYEGSNKPENPSEPGPSSASPVQLARPLVNTQLEAGRQIDPFKNYPAHWQEFFPRLVDHCKFRNPQSRAASETEKKKGEPRGKHSLLKRERKRKRER